MAPLLARVSKPKIRGHRGNPLLLVMFVIFWLLRQSIPADPLESASTFPKRAADRAGVKPETTLKGSLHSSWECSDRLRWLPLPRLIGQLRCPTCSSGIPLS
jgi:hypothetical protein